MIRVINLERYDLDGDKVEEYTLPMDSDAIVDAIEEELFGAEEGESLTLTVVNEL